MTPARSDTISASEHAFAYPAFRLYYVGAVLGTNGGWIIRILLSWLAWDLTRSPVFVGVIASASLLPVAFIGPIFGAIVDRMSIKKAYIRVTLSLQIVPITLFALIAFDALNASILLIIAVLFGVIMSAYHPARQSLGPRLVGRAAIGSVVALSSLNFNIGRLLAPAVGGILISSHGVLPTAALGIILAIPNMFVAPFLKPREDERTNQTGSLAQNLAQGFRVVWSRWTIRRSILLTVCGLGLLRGMAEILAIVADGVFDRGAQGLGLMTSALGFGALFAAFGQIFFGTRFFRRMNVRVIAITLGFIGVLALVYGPNFNVALFGATLMGFASTFVGVSLQVGVQARLEDELRGRVMSIWFLSNTLSTALVAFLISGLSGWIGLPWAVSLTLVASSVAVIAILLRWGQKDV